MSIWGVANPLPLPVVTTTGDVTCAAGTATTCIQPPSNFIAAAGLNVYPWAIVTLAILFGAAVPTAMSFLVQIPGSGTFQTYTVAPASMVALATTVFCFGAVGVGSRSTWAGAGNNIDVAIQPTTNGVTMKGVGSSLLCGLGHGPDA